MSDTDTEYYHYTDTEYFDCDSGYIESEYYHYADCDCDICLEARYVYSNFTNFTYDKYSEYITDLAYMEYVKYLEKHDFITFEEYSKNNC